MLCVVISIPRYLLAMDKIFLLGGGGVTEELDDTAVLGIEHRSAAYKTRQAP